MSSQQIAKAIAEFANDLDQSKTMHNRKEIVIYLSNKIGSVNANKIADIFGLTLDYYKI